MTVQISISPNDWADFWRYEVGVNVIPADSKNKIALVKWKEDPRGNWQEEPIPEDLHDEWKAKGMFDKGMAVICGQVMFGKHKGLWFNGIDCDNKLGIDELCPSGINEVANMTVVEQHANKGKCHIYWYTDEPIESKVANDGKGGTVPQIEVKSGGKFLLYCSGGIHKDGSPIEIIGTREIKKLDDKDDFEKRINDICKKYGIPYLDKKSTKSKVEIKSILVDGIKEGERNPVIFKSACHMFDNDNLDYETGLYLCKVANNSSEKPLDNSEVVRTVKSAWDRITNKELKFDGKDAIDNVVKVLREKYNFTTVAETNEILLYNEKIYNSIQANALIKSETEKLIPNCTEHDRNEVIAKLKAKTYKDLKEFDNNLKLLTIENGILNIETLELVAHTPEYHSRILLPIEYIELENKIHNDTIFEDIEKNLKNTEFWKFLVRSFTIDDNLRKEDVITVLEIMASCFIKKSIDEKAFMFLGKGENGKSVCLEYLTELIGKDNIENISLQLIAQDKFMSANLDGKLLNSFPDLENDELKKTGVIKAITSNEGITVQRKHGHPFKLNPFCSLIFSCNKFPKVYDQTQGFFRRWVIVKWQRNFENDPARDEHLKTKLKNNQKEKNIVFSNLIWLSNHLLKTGKFTYSKDWKQTQNDWNANADPLDDFVTNYIIESDGNKSKKETFEFYKKIQLEKQQTPLGIGQFSKAFAEYFEEIIVKENNKTQRVWCNIDFKEPKQTTMNEVDDQ